MVLKQKQLKEEKGLFQLIDQVAVRNSGGASRQQELDQLVTLYPHQKEENDERMGSAHFLLLFSSVF